MEARYMPPRPRRARVLGPEWFDKEGKQYPRCDGCGGPIAGQAEHDTVCGWSQIKGRSAR